MYCAWRGPRVIALGFALSSALLAIACEDDASSLGVRRGRNGDDPAATTTGDGGTATAELTQFQKLEPNLLKDCGRTCHDTGAFVGAPPFLKGPDIYKSIKEHPGIVVRDVFASALLTKGPHAGPARSALAELEAEFIKGLEAEAVAI